MRILVTGGRDYANFARVIEVLDQLHKHKPVTAIIHGGAAGADQMAGMWAYMTSGVEIHAFPVDAASWSKFGNRAGSIRNGNMLKVGKPDLVVAFPGGNGTKDMVTRAKAAGVPVVIAPDSGKLVPVQVGELQS